LLLLAVHRGDYIFVDESGDIGLLPKSIRPYYIISFLHCKRPDILRQELKRFLMRLHNKNVYPPELSELKFYLPYGYLCKKVGYTYSKLDDEFSIHLPIIRTRALQLVRDLMDGIYIAVLNKKTVIHDTWTPNRLGNFIFADTLILNVLNQLSLPTIPTICYDDGRFSYLDRNCFYDYVVRKDSYYEYYGRKSYIGKLSESTFKEVASHSEPCIWAADLVAGAFYYKFAKGDGCYSNILNHRMIGDGIRHFWRI
jgi:hypothetical protein